VTSIPNQRRQAQHWRDITTALCTYTIIKFDSSLTVRTATPSSKLNDYSTADTDIHPHSAPTSSLRTPFVSLTISRHHPSYHHTLRLSPRPRNTSQTHSTSTQDSASQNLTSFRSLSRRRRQCPFITLTKSIRSQRLPSQCRLKTCHLRFKRRRDGFALFALKDLRAGEEVLAWEWDDNHAIHQLLAIIECPHMFP
jgi:hypothetical protein